MNVDIPTAQPWLDGLWATHILQQAGYQAWFVGGCVRDLLLARPIHDVDVCTDAHPEQVAVLFPRVLEIGRSFGVMIAISPLTGNHVEIATYRSDGISLDGRRPEKISFTTVEEDVRRRDFTINGLLLHPRSGEIIDHVAGLADLQNHTLRLIGVPIDRLREDRLRVLRGLRFCAHLGFTCDPATWSALCTTTIEGLSRERIWQEWDKALHAPGRTAWLRLLVDSGHLLSICPLLQLTSLVFSQLDQITPEDDPLLSDGIVLAHTSSPAIWPWLTSNPLPRERIRRLRWLRETAEALACELPIAQRRRLLQHPDAALLVRYLALRGEVPLAGQWLATERKAGSFIPFLRANDLLAFGLQPGPEIGRLLRQLEDAQLSGEIPNVASAKAWVQATLSR